MISYRNKIITISILQGKTFASIAKEKHISTTRVREIFMTTTRLADRDLYLSCIRERATTDNLRAYAQYLTPKIFNM